MAAKRVPHELRAFDTEPLRPRLSEGGLVVADQEAEHRHPRIEVGMTQAHIRRDGGTSVRHRV